VTGAGPIRVREREPADEPVVAPFLEANHSARVARRGVVEHPLRHPALIAEGADGRLLGVLTYVIDGRACEILTLHAAERQGGVGSALIEAVRERATAAGCTRLWLITTNDNVDALRFYQRRGFRLTAVHAGAVDDARARLKPQIPAIGAYGIPLRDELELELLL
jgi:ribosomal protein S18 acetylase RimI-like enzyme